MTPTTIETEEPMNRPMQAHVDTASEAEWYRYLEQFRDASVYQTCAYATSAAGGGPVSRMVLEEAGEVIALALARIVRVPVLGCGVAYVAWGPLWRRFERPDDPDTLAGALDALREEYTVRRGLMLRITPNIIREESDAISPLLEGRGFQVLPGEAPYRTAIVDVSPSLEDIRAALRPRWRSYLNKVEKSGLEVSRGTSDELFGAFEELYATMLDRKQFQTSHTPPKFRRAQLELPDALKMDILLAVQDGRPVAGLVGSIAGDTAIYLLGATSQEGLEARASYLLHWRMIEIAKRRGCRWYDLCGIDPEGNPGGYQFKAGFRGRECEFVGTYQASGSVLSRASVRTGEYLRKMRRTTMWRLGMRRPVVWVTCPSACDTALRLPRSALVYQRTDRFEEFPGVDVQEALRYDSTLKQSADLTVFVNRTLFEEEGGACRAALLSDHGVDYDLFASAKAEPQVPPDLVEVPRPIAGFFGGIDDHTSDIELVEAVVRRLPDVSFVFVGKASVDCSRLLEHKNVWMLGQRPYEQIPHYGKCFDVCLMPWRQNRWIEACNPVKLKEYLALEKPVVTTPFRELAAYGNVVYKAVGAEAFAAAIRTALAEDSDARRARRGERVREHTWDRKAEEVLHAIELHTAARLPAAVLSR